MKMILLILFISSFSLFAQEAAYEEIVQSAQIEKCSYELIPCKDQLYLSDRIQSIAIDYSDLDKKIVKRIKQNEEQDIPVIVKGYIYEGRCTTCAGGMGEYFKVLSVEFLPQNISIREKDESRSNSSDKIHIDLEHLNPFTQKGPFGINKQ